MTPRRIAYVLDIFPKLSETFIARELAELRRRGAELRILSLRPPREEIRHEFIRRAGLEELTEYDPARFEGVVRGFQPDVLHAHFARDATATARELSLRTAVPFTFTAHGYDIHRKPPADFRERALAAGAVVTVSEANAIHIHNTFNVPREQLHVIPCGVDTEQFHPARNGDIHEASAGGGAPGDRPEEGPDGRAASPDAPEAPLILCIARHVQVKNLGLLLDACAILRDRGARFRCVMVGDGPLRLELEARRVALGLQSLVEMPGAAEQQAVLRWWQRAAVGVLTSDNEGMPVCLMEAAACGVPVVATAVGGVPELVRGGETGLLAKPGDPESVAAALERLLTDPSLRLRMGIAARREAEERFTVSRQVDALLELWTRILTQGPRTISRRSTADTPLSSGTPQLGDPSDARSDPALPALAEALDLETARRRFKRRLPRLSGEGKLRLKAIRVTRHKPGRRCVVEYDVEVDRPGTPRQRITLIGKARARRSGNEGFRLQEQIWNAGFQADSPDAVSVPEPVGVIPDFQMWFQLKVPGVVVERLLAGPDGPALAGRVAGAIHKLHCAGVPTTRQHLMTDELRILRECLGKVTELKPGLSTRLARITAACEQLGATIPQPALCGIHRDFYPAQVIVDGERLWLIDFDLYCLGDPGLDVGNFLGHVTEQALREQGDAQAFSEFERALAERFAELSGDAVNVSVRAYTTLTLVRHIYLSTQVAGRNHLTTELVGLCERRLGIA